MSESVETPIVHDYYGTRFDIGCVVAYNSSGTVKRGMLKKIVPKTRGSYASENSCNVFHISELDMQGNPIENKVAKVKNRLNLIRL